MKYHIVVHRKFDLDAITSEAQAGKCPRNGFAMIRDRLGATVHMPGSTPITMADRLKSKVSNSASHWALARSVKSQVSNDDVIYCSGEDVGYPVVASYVGRRHRPKIAMFVHNVNRPRSRAMLKLLGAGRLVDLFFTISQSQKDFLVEFLKVPESRVHVIPDQTDMKFFTPGPPTPGKVRPIIASVGLEQRDYRTLARATQDLDVDVRISGFSTDAAVQGRAMPETLPANMSQKFYDWPALVQLYRDADIIAVSLFPCEYAAGITSLTEGLSCRRPVVVTRTNGIAEYLDPEIFRVTPTGDDVALRSAIVQMLDDPASAAVMAQRGYEQALRLHDSDAFVDKIVGLLKAL